MRLNKILATCAVLPWLALAWFVSMPLRWELQHSYGHWIRGVGEALPALTRFVALPALGIGAPSLPAFVSIFLFWGILWLWPTWALIWVWRAREEKLPPPGLAWGFVAHVGAVALLIVVVGCGLWLPFAAL